MLSSQHRLCHHSTYKMCTPYVLSVSIWLFEAEVHGHIHNALTPVLSLTFSDYQCYTHDRNAMNQTPSTLASTIRPSNLPLFKFFDDRGGPEAQGRRGGHGYAFGCAVRVVVGEARG